MKPIFIIQCPIEQKESKSVEFENIANYLKDDYYTLVYFDNQCESLNFRMFENTEFNDVNFSHLLLKFSEYLTSNSIDILKLNDTEIKESIINYMLNKLNK